MTIEPSASPSNLQLPLTEGPVRFSVGSPGGLTSNSWRFSTTSSGDSYLACRDNAQEMKVSLHASGRWRMAFTSEALAKNPALVPAGANRAWEVWEEPPPVLPDTVVAFRLIFPTSELAVRPEQRTTKQWRDTLFIESASPNSGKLTVVTLFVTVGDPELRHESEPSLRFASLELNNGRRAQLVAHADPELDMPNLIASNRAEALKRATSKGSPYSNVSSPARTCAGPSRAPRQGCRAGTPKGIDVPDEGYLYFFGKQPDGARFIVGARARP